MKKEIRDLLIGLPILALAISLVGVAVILYDPPEYEPDQHYIESVRVQCKINSTRDAMIFITLQDEINWQNYSLFYQKIPSNDSPQFNFSVGNVITIMNETIEFFDDEFKPNRDEVFNVKIVNMVKQSVIWEEDIKAR